MATRKPILKRVFLFAKIVLSASLLFFLVTQLDTETIRDLILTADPVWFVLVFALYFAQILAATKRWSYVIESLRHHISFGTAFRLTMVGQFFNQCLPSNIGGDAMRMYYLRNAGIDTPVAISSVLLDRIMGLVVLIVLATVSLPFLANHIGQSIAFVGMATLVGLCWGGALILLFFDNPLTQRFRGHKVLGFLFGLSKSAREIVLHPGIASRIFLSSLVIHLCSVGIAWAIDKSLAGETSFGLYLIAMVPTLLVVSIPVSIAGWGIREQALVIILGGMGVTSTHAFSVSILFGAVLIVGSIPGVIFWLRSGRRTAQD